MKDEIRSARQLVDSLPSPSFQRSELTDVHPKIIPAFVRSELGKQYELKDKSVNRLELSKRLKDPVIKPGGIDPFARENQFQYPEYNFSEVITIVETESLVARAFSRKEIMCLKQGWDLVGKNPKTVAYIKKRLSEIAHVSGVSTFQLIRDIASDLIMFSNWFGTFVRNARFSSGKRRNIGGSNVDPIAGIFSIPAETVLLKFDKKGNVNSIAQQIWGNGFSEGIKKNVFNKNRFVHFKINELKGYSVGTPLLVATKDDIAALRRIEENVEILLYQHLFPLYKYKVGTVDAPAREYPGGLTEVDVVEEKWANLPPEGAIVVPERHDLEVLGAKGAAIDAPPYLEHFKKRVLAGIEISSLDIGDGDTSNRSTSDSLSRILIDGVKYLQRRIEWYFNNHIIKPLMMESTFGDEEILDPDNMVHLRFKEIDINELIKVQNHSQQLYSSHGITEVEFRRSLGEEPLSEEERQQTYWKLIDEPRELIRAKQSAFSAEAEALANSLNSSITHEGLKKEQESENEKAKAKAKSSNEPIRSRGERAIASQNRPSNQHGTKLGPTGRKSSATFYSMLFNDNQQTANPTSFLTSDHSLFSFWNESINQLKFLVNVDSETISSLFAINMFAGAPSFNKLLLSRLYEGIKDALEESNSNESAFNVRVSSLFLKEIEKQIDHLIEKLIKDVNKKSEELRKYPDLLASDMMNSLSYRVKFIDGNESSRAYNLGRALGFRHVGFDHVEVKPLFEDSCKKCKAKTKIALNDITYLKMPPLAHPNARQLVIPVK